MATDAEQETLRVEVVALREVVTELVVQLEQLPDQVQAEVAAKAVPREELTERLKANATRTIALMVMVLLLIGAAVLWNRITLQQAQDQARADVRALVRDCTFNAARLNAAQVGMCEQRIPGFQAARAAAAKRAADYDQLVKTVRQLERDMANLRAVIAANDPGDVLEALVPFLVVVLVLVVIGWRSGRKY